MFSERRFTEDCMAACPVSAAEMKFSIFSTSEDYPAVWEPTPPFFFLECQNLLTQSSVECVLLIPAHCLYETMPPSGPSVYQDMTWNFMCAKVHGGEKPLILGKFGQQGTLLKSVGDFFFLTAFLLILKVRVM